MAAPSSQTGPPYKLLAKIGEGGMGELYRAEWRQQDVIVELFPGHLGRRQGERFFRDMRAIARVTHPGICRIHDVGTIDDRPFLVMEAVDGETLRQRLAKGPLAPKEAIEYGLSVGRALAALHKEGLVYRNIRPDNVFVDAHSSGVKLFDFALVSSVGAVEGLGERVVASTSPYVAPEVLDGEPAAAAEDVYGLAVLVWEMLTGNVGLRSGEATEKLRAMSFPGALADVLRTATKTDLKLRYPTAVEMVRGLLEAQRAILASEQTEQSMTAVSRLRTDSVVDWLFSAERRGFFAIILLGGLAAILARPAGAIGDFLREFATFVFPF